jgi:hypothetical protein
VRRERKGQWDKVRARWHCVLSRRRRKSVSAYSDIYENMRNESKKAQTSRTPEGVLSGALDKGCEGGCNAKVNCITDTRRKA